MAENKTADKIAAATFEHQSSELARNVLGDIVPPDMARHYLWTSVWNRQTRRNEKTTYSPPPGLPWAQARAAARGSGPHPAPAPSLTLTIPVTIPPMTTGRRGAR